MYSPLAEALIEATLEQRPDLRRYPDLVSSWADNEAKAALVRVGLEEHGLFGQGTRPRAAINVLKLFDGAAARDRRELGLTPMSEITLTKLRAETVAAADVVSIEELRDIGRKAKGRRVLAVHSRNVWASSDNDGTKTNVRRASSLSATHNPTSVLPVPQAITN